MLLVLHFLYQEQQLKISTNYEMQMSCSKRLLSRTFVVSIAAGSC